MHLALDTVRSPPGTLAYMTVADFWSLYLPKETALLPDPERALSEETQRLLHVASTWDIEGHAKLFVRRLEGPVEFHWAFLIGCYSQEA